MPRDPSTVLPEDRLFLINRLIANVFEDDDIIDEFSADILMCVQYIACGTVFEAPEDVYGFLKKRFPPTDVLWTFIFPGKAKPS